MHQERSYLLILLTHCMLFGIAYGLTGEHVSSVKSDSYYFVVSLSKRHNNSSVSFVIKHFCTGTLLSRKSVLTAAHCLFDKHPDQVKVIAGSSNLQKGHKYPVHSWTTFRQWYQNRTALYPLNDIAVVFLHDHGITQQYVHPVQVFTVESQYLEHHEIRMLGWGNTETGRQPLILRIGKLTVVTNTECSHQGALLKGKTFTVPPNYFCSKADPWIMSTCGDGGAPILNENRRLVGINIGPCPYVEGYPQDMLNQLLMNSHLNLQYYRNFLSHVVV